MSKEKQFNKWHEKVEELLMRDYRITVGDCTDDEQLAIEFKQNSTPQEFVDFIGEKYDLFKFENGATTQDFTDFIKDKYKV